MTRLELQAIALKRLEEAECLFNNSFFDGAFYLGGYSIEAAFKARICNLLSCDYPPLPKSQIGRAYKIHNLEELFALGGLETHVNLAPNEKALKFNLSIILSWSEQHRYEAITSKSSTQVKDFLDAISNPTDGILTWIKLIW